MKVTSFRDLVVWQKAMLLVESVYSLTRQFPEDEKFGLTSQIRRAAVSIPSNIAEGQGRYHTSDYIRFLTIARGSLHEVDTQFEIALRLGFLSPNDAQEVISLLHETGRLLNGLIQSLRRTATGQIKEDNVEYGNFSQDVEKSPGKTD